MVRHPCAQAPRKVASQPVISSESFPGTLTRRSRRSSVLLSLPVAFSMLMLGSCAASPAVSSPRDPTDLETTLQALVQERGEGSGLRIERLHEESCLSRERNEHPETETRWSGTAEGEAPPPEQTHAALDRMALHLEEAGWELVEETTNPEDYNGEIRSLTYQKDELAVTATYENQGASSKFWEVFISTPCQQNPEGHQLVRSELDPDYGTPSSIYSDGK